MAVFFHIFFRLVQAGIAMAHLISRSAVAPNVYSAISKLDILLIWWLAVLALGVAAEALYLALNATGWLP